VSPKYKDFDPDYEVLVIRLTHVRYGPASGDWSACLREPLL